MKQVSNLWSPQEVNFLMSHFDDLSTEQLAQALERSMGSVRVQACRLNLSARHGREKAFKRRRLEADRLAFCRDPCMVTPSSRVGKYWPLYNIPR
jgi:hypothetical protein|tara:strand:- start:62 stop:346 length:285 start_codon:yes stop_codon:yes gene_type:complete